MLLNKYSEFNVFYSLELTENHSIRKRTKEGKTLKFIRFYLIFIIYSAIILRNFPFSPKSEIGG